MNKTFKLISISLILLTYCCVYLNDSFNNRMDQFITNYVDYNMFSGHVLVAKDGKIIFNKSYGYENFGNNKTIEQDTRVCIGSVSKQFAAMSIMILQDRGLLDIDNKISEYLTDYQLGNKMTVRQLLTHTSGITRDISNIAAGFDEMGVFKEKEEIYRIITSAPLDNNPGTVFSYSNAGYFLLGLIVEEVSGLEYGTFLKTNIFDPLGMNNSGFDINHVLPAHTFTTQGIVSDWDFHPSITFAAGGVYSTASDMYLWDRALYTETLIPEESMNEVFDKTVKTSDNEWYGFGWTLSQRNINGKNIDIISHYGQTRATTSIISRYPDYDAVIIVTANIGNASVNSIVSYAEEEIIR